jgi:hypothetical protein
VDPAAPQPLAAAVAQLILDAGGSPDEEALAADAADVPRDLQVELARVVLAAGRANLAFAALIQPFSADELDQLSHVGSLFLMPQVAPPRLTEPATQTLLGRRFDVARMVAPAVDLARAIERADLSRFAGTRGFAFDQSTPIGRVVVRDAADHVDKNVDVPLLLLDTGGNDTYTSAVGTVDGANDLARARHVGIAIDLGGDDDYGYQPFASPLDGARLPSDGDGRSYPVLPVEQAGGPVSLSDTPRQGAARLGYGFLFDLGGGRDHYHSLRMSQGFAVAGVGVLYDDGGDDRYEGEAAVQVAAAFGVGLLYDAGGNDVYRTYVDSQGFGFVRGVGVLYDRAGDDSYLADVGDPAAGGDPLYLTPQLPGRGNASFVQGAGLGRRAPGDTDRVFMSGGVGLLRDRRGDDVYTASVFAQATGYWFGTGILADGAGDDRYDAKYYVQGAAAHYALAVFLEDAGDDRYNTLLTPAATSIGTGHDFSVAWHIDSGGDDRYVAPVLAMGAGNMNGIGVLINIGGDDQYRAEEPALPAGRLSPEAVGQDERRAVRSVGIFVDIGGHDRYAVGSSQVARGDDSTWHNVFEPADGGASGECSAGVDRASGQVSLP